MKIVQFEDGNYGLRAYWFFGWHFYSLNSNFTWCDVWKINTYCKGSLSQVQNRWLEINIGKQSKKHKVVNVI